MVKADQNIIYNLEPYKIIRVYPSGYCEIQKNDSSIVEIIHKKDIKDCPKVQ